MPARAGVLLGGAIVTLMTLFPLHFSNQILVLLFGGNDLSPVISIRNAGGVAPCLDHPRAVRLGIPCPPGAAGPSGPRREYRIMRMTSARVAFRNFTRNGRRFFFIGAAVCAAFFFICTVQGLVAGFYSQVNTRGARFYGGHVVVSRVDGKEHSP